MQWVPRFTRPPLFNWTWPVRKPCTSQLAAHSCRRLSQSHATIKIATPSATPENQKMTFRSASVRGSGRKFLVTLIAAKLQVDPGSGVLRVIVEEGHPSGQVHSRRRSGFPD